MSVTLNSKVQRTAAVEEALLRYVHSANYNVTKVPARGKRVKSKAYIAARKAEVERWVKSTEAV